MDDHQTDRSRRIIGSSSVSKVSDQEDTIAAIATPPGSGGVGVIRISGENVRQISLSLLGECPQARVASYQSFKSQDRQIIDQGLALFFPAPKSFTGEDVLELHGHGGTVVMASLLKQVMELGARQARPGEFSERAFLNGKIDLVQAEAVVDLISSASDEAAKSAIRSLTGEFSEQIKQLAKKIIAIRTLIEAHMDFTEEELEIPVESFKQSVNQALQQNEKILSLAIQGAVLNEGMRIAIIGPPNVGKSSLLNALLQQDRAIVTDTPGTTRDTLTEKFLLQGIPFLITDTAGLRDTVDPIEQEGINRSKKAMQETDVVIVMSEIGEQTQLQNTHTNAKVLYLVNKIDRQPDLKDQQGELRETDQKTEIYLSVKSEKGLDLLKTELLKLVGINRKDGSEGVFTARQRHIKALENSRDFLSQSEPCLASTESFDLAAENLRLALHSLGEITGEFTTEDLLGEIFSGFCVGK